MSSRSPHQLLANNRAWAEQRTRTDPQFFARLSGVHAPGFLWIGCSDARVPANEIVGLPPGELFVHRNIANVVAPDDANCTAVLQYAVEVLHVEHVIVCGHYGCGGVQAALGQALHGSLERWLQHVRDVRTAHADALSGLADHDARARRLAELNVMAQVEAVGRVPAVREAWHRGQLLAVHGWIYDLRDGLLCDLNVSVTALPS